METVAVAAVTSGLATAMDLAVRAHPDLRAASQLFGLGAAAGAIAGAALALALVVLGVVRSRGLRAILLVSFTLVWSFFALESLGVLDRLSGSQRGLAWTALAAVLGVAAASVVVVSTLIPTLASAAEHPLGGAYVEQHPRARRVLVFGLFCSVIGALALDAGLWPDRYAVVHDTLRRVARAALFVAPLAAGFSPRMLKPAALVAAAFAIWSLVTIDDTQSAMLARARVSPLSALALDELRALGDRDHDGFSAWLGGGDCAPFDAEIHPNAREIPRNGVDDNCRAGDLTEALVAPPEFTPTRSHDPGVSVVLITIDTLRADHVSGYGYGRPTTPTIDAWFASGTRFDQAMAAGAYTTISVPALLRGYSPRRLSWVPLRQTSFFRLVPMGIDLRLERDERWLNAHLATQDVHHLPLPVLFQMLGHRTAAVVDDGGSAFLSTPLAGQGFERFEYIPESLGIQSPGGDAEVARRALEVLAARDERPFFLWIHFFGVHAPDARHDGTPVFGEDLVSRYDHEIAHVDRVLGPVLAALASIEQERSLVTVLTSDHGERFMASGRGHGTNLAEEEIRVPLLMRGHGIGRGVRPDVVSLIDIAPTVLGRARVHQEALFEGRDLFAPGARPDRIVLSDVWRYDALGHLELDRVAAINRDRRLVYEPATNSYRLFTRGAAPVPRTERAPDLVSAIDAYLEITGPVPGELAE